jgi:nucleoside-diphosphate-sugar epimerase
MKRILVTGGRGFLGRNLAAHLSERREIRSRTSPNGWRRRTWSFIWPA